MARRNKTKRRPKKTYHKKPKYTKRRNKVTRKRRKNTRIHKSNEYQDGGLLSATTAVGLAAKTGAVAWLGKKAAEKLTSISKEKVKKILLWVVSSFEFCLNESLQSYANPMALKDIFNEIQEALKDNNIQTLNDIFNNPNYRREIEILKEAGDSNKDEIKKKFKDCFKKKLYGDIESKANELKTKPKKLKELIDAIMANFGKFQYPNQVSAGTSEFTTIEDWRREDPTLSEQIPSGFKDGQAVYRI